MNRRHFLKTSGTVLAGASLSRTTNAQASPDGGRMVLPINRGWRYSPKASEAARATHFNDAAFTRVVIPHTNVALPWHSFEEKTYEFVSVYRRAIKAPASALQNAPAKRVFVDFEGVMTASTVYLNGTRLGEYRGGYTPFSFELTGHLDKSGVNMLVVEVDSAERADIPPFGNEIDYLTFGGIYREVALRVVPQTFIENVYARPKDVLSATPTVEVECFLDRAANATPGPLSFHVEMHARDGRLVAAATMTLPEPTVTPHHAEDADQALGAQATVTPWPDSYTLTLDKLGKIDLWDLRNPNLYMVQVELLESGKVIDRESRKIGFREAVFTPKGFSLNGTVIKLHGLDRHQTFPWVGQAMPGRVQRRDAIILRHDLHCNIVRTSHYPQSRHFLDACDEVGLLVLEEIPGWQHIGPVPWQDLAVDNVRRMIRRDWNHPSIVLWGTRINESPDNHDFYTRTNALAHALDPGRQNGGIRTFAKSELLEDVFTINDFGFPLREPDHPLYLNTEFVGHTFPTKTIDDKERLQEHALRHTRIHNQLAGNPQYAGGIGWCAFDYNTHANFGSGDRICYHGVTDMWRTPKPAAYVYKAMCEPEEEIVLEPAFHWAIGDESTHFTTAVVCSNCDHLKFYIGSGEAAKMVAEVDPDHAEYPNMKRPPFTVNLVKDFHPWGDLKIEGYLGGKLVKTRMMSGKGADMQFALLPDDAALIGDGADTTRVVVRVNDEFGNVRQFASDAIQFEITGPGEIIGDNPFALVGGTGAIWVRAKEMAGTIRLKAMHPRLGSQTVEFKVAGVAAETA